MGQTEKQPGENWIAAPRFVPSNLADCGHATKFGNKEAQRLSPHPEREASKTHTTHTHKETVPSISNGAAALAALWGMGAVRKARRDVLSALVESATAPAALERETLADAAPRHVNPEPAAALESLRRAS